MNDFLGTAKATAEPDGSFKLEGLVTGKVLLTAYCRLGFDNYVQSIMAGGEDVLGREVDSAAVASGGIKVIVRSDVASVSGTLDLDIQRRAGLKNPVVLLIPTEARLRRSHMIGYMWIDGNGRFQSKAVRPGEYLSFAFENENPSRFEDPEFYMLMQGKGERVALAPGESKTLSLKLLPWPTESADRIQR